MAGHGEGAHLGVPVVGVTKIPEQPPSVLGTQANPRPEVIAAAASPGIDVIGTCGAFIADAQGITALLRADGLHPNGEGSIVWKNAVKAAHEAA